MGIDLLYWWEVGYFVSFGKYFIGCVCGEFLFCGMDCLVCLFWYCCYGFCYFLIFLGLFKI